MVRKSIRPVDDELIEEDQGVSEGWVEFDEPRPAEVKPKEPEKSPAPIQAATVVAITSAWPGVVKIGNAPSGSSYEWRCSGQTLLVAAEDVEFVMSRNRSAKRACCGSSGRTYFVLSE